MQAATAISLLTTTEGASRKSKDSACCRGEKYLPRELMSSYPQSNGESKKCVHGDHDTCNK